MLPIVYWVEVTAHISSAEIEHDAWREAEHDAWREAEPGLLYSELGALFYCHSIE